MVEIIVWVGWVVVNCVLLEVGVEDWAEFDVWEVDG